MNTVKIGIVYIVNVLLMTSIQSAEVEKVVKRGSKNLNDLVVEEAANAGLKAGLGCEYNVDKKHLPLDLKLLNVVSEYNERSKATSEAISAKVRLLKKKKVSQSESYALAVKAQALHNLALKHELMRVKVSQTGYALAAKASLAINLKMNKLKRKCLFETVTTSKLVCNGKTRTAIDMVRISAKKFGYAGRDDFSLAYGIEESLNLVRNCEEARSLVKACGEFASFMKTQTAYCLDKEAQKFSWNPLEILFPSANALIGLGLGASIGDGINVGLGLSTPILRAQLSLGLLGLGKKAQNKLEPEVEESNKNYEEINNLNNEVNQNQGDINIQLGEGSGFNRAAKEGAVQLIGDLPNRGKGLHELDYTDKDLKFGMMSAGMPYSDFGDIQDLLAVSNGHQMGMPLSSPILDKEERISNRGGGHVHSAQIGFDKAAKEMNQDFMNAAPGANLESGVRRAVAAFMGMPTHQGEVADTELSKEEEVKEEKPEDTAVEMEFTQNPSELRRGSSTTRVVNIETIKNGPEIDLDAVADEINRMNYEKPLEIDGSEINTDRNKNLFEIITKTYVRKIPTLLGRENVMDKFRIKRKTASRTFQPEHEDRRDLTGFQEIN